MTADNIRFFRHRDGRHAVSYFPGNWTTVDRDTGQMMSYKVHDVLPIGNGWKELVLIELPGPDYFIDCVGSDGDDVITPAWTSKGTTFVSWIEGVEVNDQGLMEDLDEIRRTATIMFAAVDATERMRVEYRRKKLNEMRGTNG